MATPLLARAQHPHVTAHPQFGENQRPAGIRVDVARLGQRAFVQSEGVFRALRHSAIMWPSRPVAVDPTPSAWTTTPAGALSHQVVSRSRSNCCCADSWGMVGSSEKLNAPRSSSAGRQSCFSWSISDG